MNKQIIPDTCYIKNPDIVYREIGREQLLVPIHRTAGEIDGIYTLTGYAVNSTAYHM